MTLSIIGAGFGRTGTHSVRLALDELGFGPCYHMENVFASAAGLERWRKVVDGEPPDWESLFDGFVSTVDWPGTTYWSALVDAYPSAKVLLTVRPTDSWFPSFSRTIRKLIDMRAEVRDDHARAVLDFAHKNIAEQTFGGHMENEAAVRAAYEQRIVDVQNSVSPERLLVFDVRDGWEPLCEFLGVSVPAIEFPYSNTEEDFWKSFGAAAG